MGEFDGRVALVTGGALGIGRGIVEEFAAAGAAVAIADVNADAAGALASELGRAGHRAIATVGDVASAADADRMVAETIAAFGRLDILVNNAGIHPAEWFFRVEDMPEDAWDRILDVNLKGIYLMAKAASPQIRRAGGGAIVNIASVQGLDAAHGPLVRGEQRRRPLAHAPDGARLCPGEHPRRRRLPRHDRHRHVPSRRAGCGRRH